MLTVVADGTLSSDNTQRVFGVEIQLPAVKSGVLHISLNCSSPAEDFAFLDKEGDTYIHSTVRGSCIAKVTRMDEMGSITTKEYVSDRKNLLEIKN